ncbi:MAG TPA: HipA family kinase [Chitinophagaceae bacterium]
MKLTDPEYFLPEIFALSCDKVLVSGTTQPMLIRGVCKITEMKSDYVVKFISSPRMSIMSSCSELVAAFIGLELGLNVAEPAIIDITNDFVETLRGKDGYKNASNSVGLNFGCKFVPGLMEFASRQQLSDNLYEQAEHIFSFDIFISNVDRRTDKPNMLTDGEKILLFDHELAFGFVMDIIKNPKPWLISKSDLGWIKNHYFFPILKGNEHNFDAFVDKLTVLNDEFWDKLQKIIPAVWLTDHFDKIKNNLASLVLHKDQFKEQLNKILS